MWQGDCERKRFTDLRELLLLLGVDVDVVWKEWSEHYTDHDIRLMKLENRTLTELGIMEKEGEDLAIDIAVENSKFDVELVERDGDRWEMVINDE